MPARILVMNDNQKTLEMFDQLLREEGYETVLRSQAFSDVDEVEKVTPDLIILDYILGGEQVGWQMLQQLKMRPATANIPVVICTAAVQTVREMEGFVEMKGITLVAKPFDIDDLLTAVRQALQFHNGPPGQPAEQKNE